MNIISNNILNTRAKAAIIPHAGKYYAGDCRKNAFINLDPDTKYIIYIAAIHNSRGLENDAYLLKKDVGFPEFLNIPKLPHREHSFDWVEDELRSYFTNAKIFAFSPLNFNTKYVKQIVYFMNKNNCILLSTTDLVHYGKNFDFTIFGYPEKLQKQIYEEEFLYQITKKKINLDKINREIKKNNLMCGPYAMNMFMTIIKKLEYTGKIIDYYDSSSSMEDDLLNKYTIKPENTNNFVSYVSVIYGPNIERKYLTKFDIMTAIGMVKSKIYQDVYDQNNRYKLKFPKWSVFNKRYHGIFVGTELNGKTNCSYGRFKDNYGGLSSNKILEASGDCKLDASGRWRNPYSKNNLEKMKYKVELLDSKVDWERIKGNEILRKFKLDGKHGLKIRFPDGAGATYLPIVAKDMLNKWSIKDYMNSLTLKAYGNKREENVWNNSNVEVEIYKSTSYTWNPVKNNIEIF